MGLQVNCNVTRLKHSLSQGNKHGGRGVLGPPGGAWASHLNSQVLFSVEDVLS